MVPMLMGLLMGVVSATPMLYALGAAIKPDRRMDAGRLIACGLVPFLVLQSMLLAVWLLWPAAVVAFGVSAALALLVVVTVGVARVWRHWG